MKVNDAVLLRHHKSKMTDGR